MKKNIQALFASLIAVIFICLVPATSAFAKTCKPSSHLVEAAIDAKKNLSNYMLPQIMAQVVIDNI